MRYLVSIVTATLAALLATGPASAQNPLPGTFSGLADFRLSVSDGERGWTDGGFGKLRHGSDNGNWEARPELARGALIWRNHFTFSTSAYVQIEVDPLQDDVIGINEAWINYKAPPREGLKLSGRAGAFYPPISLEHDGKAWGVTRTITPSAINSWIGEEVKVAGVEATAVKQLGQNELSVTGAIFGYNDTSGTLLTFRGWALHDHQAPLNAAFPLPERDDAWWVRRGEQARVAEPFRELDERVGYYGRVEVRPQALPIAISLFYYDNHGDKESRSFEDGQTSWQTRFINLGLHARLGEGLELFGQAMAGETVWMPVRNGPIAYVDDIGFQSAYLMLDKTLGAQGLAVRVDTFETYDVNQPFSFVSRDEHGFALTAAWRMTLSDRATLMTEAIHVDSTRGSRLDDGLDDARQRQTNLQTSLRWEF